MSQGQASYEGKLIGVIWDFYLEWLLGFIEGVLTMAQFSGSWDLVAT